MKKSAAATVAVAAPSVSQSRSPGLSTGDEAAIGVGVVAAVILVIAAVLGWLFLRQRRRARLAEEQRVSESDKAQNPIIAAQERPELEAVPEASGTALSELPAPTSELPSQKPTAGQSKNSTARWA